MPEGKRSKQRLFTLKCKHVFVKQETKRGRGFPARIADFSVYVSFFRRENNAAAGWMCLPGYRFCGEINAMERRILPMPALFAAKFVLRKDGFVRVPESYLGTCAALFRDEKRGKRRNVW